ncbi:MAG: calcium/sodium antiporter [Candidatus Micrarchaeota archaeon]|nr:calcium/sodium antiporter [Candidatus Micrarchaeota archaeon]
MVDLISLGGFILGFGLLIKGADFLISGSVSIAKKLKVSDLFIGLTLISVGTSLPELFVSLSANSHENYDILLGNILGSNIANILLILGLGALVRRIVLSHSTVWKEIPFSLLAAFVLFIVANDVLFKNGSINLLSFSDGLILILFYFVFIYYLLSEQHYKERVGELPTNIVNLPVAIFAVIVGILMLNLGGELVVNGAVYLALLLGVSQAFVGLTIIAVGTSIPELVTSLVALAKKNLPIAVGNAVGSCIANIFLILGISTLKGDIVYSSFRNVDLFMVFVSSFVLLVASLIKKDKMVLDKFEGFFFLVLYTLYIIFLLS